MKVLVIQPKVGMGDMVIYLPYIHAISKKYQSSVSILVKENSRAKELLKDDTHINEVLLLDRLNDRSGYHGGISGFFNLAAEIVPATSGRLVPSATTVTPITIDEMPNSSASCIALSTTNELPYTVAIRDSNAFGHTLTITSSKYSSSSIASSFTNL